MKILFRGIEYKVVMKAYSLNDGEYFVCYKADGSEEFPRLIPTDLSYEVISQ